VAPTAGSTDGRKERRRRGSMNPMSVAWGFARDFGSTQYFSGCLSIGGEEVPQEHVRRNCDGRRRHYGHPSTPAVGRRAWVLMEEDWRRHGLSFQPGDDVHFFSCGGKDVGNLLNGLFNVRSHRSVFLGTTISRPSYPLAILLVEKR
jgi:hypothetical protein